MWNKPNFAQNLDSSRFVSRVLQMPLVTCCSLTPGRASVFYINWEKWCLSWIRLLPSLVWRQTFRQQSPCRAGLVAILKVIYQEERKKGFRCCWGTPGNHSVKSIYSIESILRMMHFFSGVLWTVVIFTADHLVHYLQFSFHEYTLLTHMEYSFKLCFLTDQRVLCISRAKVSYRYSPLPTARSLDSEDNCMGVFLWDDDLPSSQKCPPTAVETTVNGGKHLMKFCPTHQTPEQKLVRLIEDILWL